MKEKNENIPDPRTIEKELGEFLNKKFGGNVKIISPSMLPKKAPVSGKDKIEGRKKLLDFDLKPLELISYLDQYIVKQKKAKAVLATKICTHFNRIKHSETNKNFESNITGNIKANILMLGPTGVGKTYLIKLIAKKIGVPFVKADATKFSETGYVGGDIEDLIRDLVKEADDDIELAECGIVYIDEIDKIASSNNFMGSDISHTGVQRALLKPMEETDVDLRVPHDPVSMMQEIESYQKTGKRSKKSVNTANILFIVSGAFSSVTEIINKRVTKQSMGFGATLAKSNKESDLLNKLRSEDLVEFGFESEFIGRLPVRCILDELSQKDLFSILRMPNNPVILGKRLDFAAYGIDISFTKEACELFAQRAFKENTGARGLVSVVENALMLFEKELPSTSISNFTVTKEVVNDPDAELADILSEKNSEKWALLHKNTKQIENKYITTYITDNWKNLSLRHGLTLSKERSKLVAEYFCTHVTELGNAIKKIKAYYESVKKIEVDFFNLHDLNIVFEEDAVDFLIEQFINNSITFEDIMAKLHNDFYDGLHLVHEKTEKNRFFISKKSLLEHEAFLEDLIRKEIS
ncbi:MAG: AAA family ATPase [Thermodesulfobacteriota bacterium]|nr:AAA family ATPase [Thermodesulfobacteriota bacterium]